MSYHGLPWASVGSTSIGMGHLSQLCQPGHQVSNWLLCRAVRFGPSTTIKKKAEAIVGIGALPRLCVTHLAQWWWWCWWCTQLKALNSEGNCGTVCFVVICFTSDCRLRPYGGNVKGLTQQGAWNHFLLVFNYNSESSVVDWSIYSCRAWCYWQ